MEEYDGSSKQVVIPKKRGRKTMGCDECRLSNAKKICTHRVLPEDVDRENLALAPAQNLVIRAITTSREEFLKYIRETMTKFVVHAYDAKWQADEFQRCKDGL